MVTFTYPNLFITVHYNNNNPSCHPPGEKKKRGRKRNFSKSDNQDTTTTTTTTPATATASSRWLVLSRLVSSPMPCRRVLAHSWSVVVSAGVGASYWLL